MPYYWDFICHHITLINCICRGIYSFWLNDQILLLSVFSQCLFISVDLHLCSLFHFYFYYLVFFLLFFALINFGEDLWNWLIFSIFFFKVLTFGFVIFSILHYFKFSCITVLVFTILLFFPTLFFPNLESEVIGFHLLSHNASKAISPLGIVFIVFHKFWSVVFIIIQLNNFLIFMLISSLIQSCLGRHYLMFWQYNFFYYTFLDDFLLTPVVKEDILKNVFKF